MRKRYVLVVAMMLIVSALALTQANPFTGSGRPGAEGAPQSSAAADAVDGAVSLSQGSPLFPRLNALLRSQQRALNARVAQLLRGSSPQAADLNRRSGSGVLIIGLVAFFYGLVHAALPGHRKVLLVSYFVSTDAPLRHAVAAGLSVAALHSGAAAVVILGTYYVLQTSLSAALDRATLYMHAATALMVLLIGALIVVSKFREVLHLRHGHHHGQEPRSVNRLKRRIGLLPAIVISAVVPCPGSAMILLFALSLGVVWLGIYATLMFSIGMAITLTSVSIIAVVSKRAVTGALDGPLGEILHVGIEGLGGLAMIAFGTIALLPVL